MTKQKQPVSPEVQQNNSQEEKLPEIDQPTAELKRLTAQLADAQIREQRALADYQNLVRRTREESVKKTKLATKDFVFDLLEPLEHLRLAAQQLNDAGLNMVITQLEQVLERNGLTRLRCEGAEFDPAQMEAVESKKHGKKVISILRNGYLLHGEMIQPAKVVLD
jgi:molecular chaperone GrpE